MATKTNQVTQEIEKYLRLKGFFVWRQNNGAVYDAKKKIWRSNSSFRGVPDIIGADPEGKFFGIEIKTGKDKLSTFQESFIVSMLKQGGTVIVAGTLDEVITFVSEKYESQD